MKRNTCLMVMLFCILAVYIYSKNTVIEGATFSECRSKGFSKEFCLQTPASLPFGPASCRCEDGSIGRIIPGLRGECCCGGACSFMN